MSLTLPTDVGLGGVLLGTGVLDRTWPTPSRRSAALRARSR